MKWHRFPAGWGGYTPKDAAQQDAWVDLESVIGVVPNTSSGDSDSYLHLRGGGGVVVGVPVSAVKLVLDAHFATIDKGEP